MSSDRDEMVERIVAEVALPQLYWRDDRGWLHCQHGVILHGERCDTCDSAGMLAEAWADVAGPLDNSGVIEVKPYRIGEVGSEAVVRRKATITPVAPKLHLTNVTPDQFGDVIEINGIRFIRAGCAKCGAQPIVTNLDGDDLCSACATKWVQGEGQAELDRQDEGGEG